MPFLRALLVFIAAGTIVARPSLLHAQRLANPPIGPGSQSSAVRLGPSAQIPATTLQTIRDSTVYRQSHWQEGLMVGAAVGLLLGAVAGGAVCSISETSDSGCEVSALKGALLLAAPGASVGALIGGLFSKPDHPPDKAS